MRRRPALPDILDDIIFNKRQEVAALKIRLNAKKARVLAKQLPKPRDFFRALQKKKPAVIAEVKKASPSAGLIAKKFDPVNIAKRYAKGGAAALSVLTDKKYFQGSLDILKKVKRAVKLPVLRKDFIIDEAQIYESRLAGADAILLIARILSAEQLASFMAITRLLKMQALVEVQNPAELRRGLRAGARLIGINNRDLATLKVDPQRTLRLMKKFPELKKNLVVAESGIRSAAQIKSLAAAGVSAFLVGESLMKSRDIGAKLRKLRGG